MLERFKEEIGQEINYHKLGYLFLLSREEDIVVFKKNVELQHRLGVETEWLTGGEIRNRLPFMNLSDIIAGTNYPQDGTADPNSVVMGYINAAQKLGVTALTGVEVVDITTRAMQVEAVRTTKGKISTRCVVNAAGPWSNLIGKMADVDIPVTPLRRQWLTTTPLPNLPVDFPFVIDFAQSLYFHREGEGLLTGMSNPDETSHYDQGIDNEWELVHMEAAISRLPMLAEAGLVSRLAGLYENTPDAHPIYGETPIAGFYVVVGFSGHGFMHGPISGKLMAEIILDGSASSVDISMLDIARFEEDRLIHEYNVV
jgi:sarcosine oxidase subunit beta